MGYFSGTKKSCISVFYIRTKFQSTPYNNKHFRIRGGTVPLRTKGRDKGHEQSSASNEVRFYSYMIKSYKVSIIKLSVIHDRMEIFISVRRNLWICAICRLRSAIGRSRSAISGSTQCATNLQIAQPSLICASIYRCRLLLIGSLK